MLLCGESRWPGFRQPHDHSVHPRYETERWRARAVLRGPPRLVDVIPNPIFHKLSVIFASIGGNIFPVRHGSQKNWTYSKVLATTSEYTCLSSLRSNRTLFTLPPSLCRRSGGLLSSGGQFSMVSAQLETTTSYSRTNPSVGTTAAQRLPWDLI